MSKESLVEGVCEYYSATGQCMLPQYKVGVGVRPMPSLAEQSIGLAVFPGTEFCSAKLRPQDKLVGTQLSCSEYLEGEPRPAQELELIEREGYERDIARNAIRLNGLDIILEMRGELVGALQEEDLPQTGKYL